MSKLFVFLVLCIASASCVELENLCSSDHFEYNGTLVNSFYKERWNITFPSLSHCLINSSVTCDRSEFVNKTNYLEVLRIKNAFNRKFAELYTEDLKNATANELEDKRFILSWNYWEPLNSMTRVEPTSKCVQTFERMVFFATNVFENLHDVSMRNSYPIWSGDFKPTRTEAIRILERLFEKLNTGADGQTFALKGEQASKVFYRRELVLPGEFKFLTNGPVQPETESMLTYEQYLPFNSDRHTDEGCVPLEKLPRFYKKKGNKY